MVDYDMHVHSTYSDGTLSVKEIIEICKEKNMKGVAITDHDTVAAFTDVNIIKENSLDIIPGIELSTYYNNSEVHILGYYIDYENEEFLKVLNKLKDFRVNRLESIICRLQKIGYDITKEDVLATIENTSSVGRPHIARCLVTKGYFKDTHEVFDKILGNGKPACVERYKLSVKEGIDLIKNAGGIPVLAHAYVTKGNNVASSDFKTFINDIISYGIMGIEVFHSLHSRIQEGNLLNYAIKNNLLVTGGSDCHEKLNSSGEYIIGSKGIDYSKIEKIKSVRR